MQPLTKKDASYLTPGTALVFRGTLPLIPEETVEAQCQVVMSGPNAIIIDLNLVYHLSENAARQISQLKSLGLNPLSNIPAKPESLTWYIPNLQPFPWEKITD